VPKPITMEAFDDEALNFIWIEDRARALMQQFGLITGNPATDWRFEFSNRRRQLGTCFHRQRKIVFSNHFDHIERSEIEDTIRHEIAHALVGPGHGHDQVWKRMCLQVGANPMRLAPAHIKSSAKHNYVIKCVVCNAEWYRYRLKQAAFRYRHCGEQVEIFMLADERGDDDHD
jgi:predicted SprT family Zn-dependent metalloprotease